MVRYYLVVGEKEAKDFLKKLPPGFEVKKTPLYDDESLVGIEIYDKPSSPGTAMPVKIRQEVYFNKDIPLNELLKIYREIEEKFGVDIHINQK